MPPTFKAPFCQSLSQHHLSVRQSTAARSLPTHHFRPSLMTRYLYYFRGFSILLLLETAFKIYPMPFMFDCESLLELENFLRPSTLGGQW
jgi:hypothetical protein